MTKLITAKTSRSDRAVDVVRAEPFEALTAQSEAVGTLAQKVAAGPPGRSRAA